MVSFDSGKISTLSSIGSMLLTIAEKNEGKLDIRIFEKDPLKASQENQRIENLDEFICKITGQQDQFEIVLAEKINDNVKSSIMCALKMTGMMDLMISYIKSSKPFKDDKYIRLANHLEFTKWMHKWFEGRTFVPDTNLLINHTVSAIELATTPDFFKKINIMIPRLAILELEKKTNKTKLDDDSCNVETPKKGKLETKRKMFMGFSELVYLQKKDNVKLFPSLTPQVLTSVPTIASDYSADAWIRHEIQNYIPNRRMEKQGQGGTSITPIPSKSFILVTSDLVNSLSASSEGIDSIYISEVRNKEDLPQFLSGSLNQITRFLIILSVLLETVYLSINSTLYRFQGFWPGITNYDIINYRIKTSSLS